eukprot:2863985-Prymnesium_polylepis.1
MHAPPPSSALTRHRWPRRGLTTHSWRAVTLALSHGRQVRLQLQARLGSLQHELEHAAWRAPMSRHVRHHLQDEDGADRPHEAGQDGQRNGHCRPEQVLAARLFAAAAARP